MKTSTLAAVAILAAGCGMTLPSQAYPPSPAEHAVLDAIDKAWMERELESIDTDACREERDYMRLIVADDDEFPALCSYCNPGNCPGYQPSEGCPWGCASACTRSPCVGSWPSCWGPGNEFLGGQEYRLFIVHSSYAEGGRVPRAYLVHEYIHVLEMCSGRGADRAHGLICRLPDGELCRRGTPDCTCRREGLVWGPGGVQQAMRP